LTYRDGVKELAYSRAFPLIQGLHDRGALPLAYDPLLTVEEIVRTGAQPWRWADPDPNVEAIVTQTADAAWLALEASWFPGLRFVLDGRNSLGDLALPAAVAAHGIGDRR
jgi:UDP-N-acetyl-D-mannosaminuronate dehydrogenase